MPPCFWYLVPSYLSTTLVDTGNVDLRDKLDRRGLVGVLGSAVDINAVYPVLMDALIQSSVSDGRHATVGRVGSGVHQRGEDRELFHSSCSSSYLRRPQDRKSMPL